MQVAFMVTIPAASSDMVAEASENARLIQK